MAETANLEIVIKAIDEASETFRSLSDRTKLSLGDVQSAADGIRNSFGIMGAAVVGVLGEITKTAADSALADQQLTTAVNAGIAAAQSDTSATDILTKQKHLLEAQLSSLNLKVKDYKQKIDDGKDSSGVMAASLDTLQQKILGVKDKLETLNNEQKLATENATDIIEVFQKAAVANTNLGFQNDQTVKSLTTLFRATGDVNEALKANQEAMDLARAKNIDLSTAATLVVQAMEGNGRALKQFGINLKDGLTPAEALAELQQKLAGSARDYVNTDWGQLDVAKAKLDLLSETLGTKLLPILTRFLETVTPVIQRMVDFANAHPQLTTNILLAAGALGLLLVAISALAAVISASITVYSAVAIAIGLISLPVLALVALFGVLAYLWITQWNNIKVGFQVVADALQSSLTTLGNWFKTTWTDISNTVQGAYNFIMGLLTPLINTINNVKSAAGNIATGASVVSGAASNVVHAIVPHLASGGIVTSPTLALIGEAGPEAVVPLGKGGYGGTNIVVNITGNNIDSSISLQRIAQQVSAEIVRALRGNMRVQV